MKEAVFSLRGYKFPMVKMDLRKIKPLQNKMNLSILPKGVFYPKNHSFELTFNFVASLEGEEGTPCIEISCIGDFEFKEIESIADIPSYFYANSIPILFPYVRAFVSTVTLQANYQPIVLPTMNLSDLSNFLKENVSVKE